jgi:predicted amidophosphoribosyltransferase
MNWLQPLLPPCTNCAHPSREFLCEACCEQLRFAGACAVCGRQPLAASRRICLPCLRQSKPWRNLEVAFRYEGGIRDWILDFKNGGHPERIRELTASMLPKPEKYDCVIPVASNPSLLNHRFYDPTIILANHLGKIWSIPVRSNIFERSEFLQSQKDLARHERLKFLKKTIRLRPRVGKFKQVLLVDDIMTSGATIEAHVRLLQHRAEAVDVFCLARTLMTGVLLVRGSREELN